MQAPHFIQQKTQIKIFLFISKMPRSFTIHTVGGRYKADIPIEAAKKAAAKLFKDTKSKSLTFCIRETTKDSKKKLYHYKATRTAKGGIQVSVNKNKKIVSAYTGVGSGLQINPSSINSEMRKSKEHTQKIQTFMKQQLGNLFNQYKDISEEQTIKDENSRIFALQDYLDDKGKFKYNDIEYQYTKIKGMDSWNFEITSQRKKKLFIFKQNNDANENIIIMQPIEITTAYDKLKDFCDGIFCKRDDVRTQ
jgi:hypothetical protein